MKRIIPCLLLVVGVAACAPAFKPVATDVAFRSSGLKKAGFELGCSDEQMQVTVLNSSPCMQREDGPYVCANAQVGVTGCGKKTTYRFPSLGNGDDWVRDSEVLTASP